LFLDEIGELTPSTQAKLLRVLQEGTFERVGGRQVIQGNARVIAATHLDIESAIAARSFREDLYYRLNQSTIFVPPLRDRTDDIPDIARYFVHIHAPRMGLPAITFSQDVIGALQSHPWPGNVRELENVVRQILIKANGQRPSPSDAAGFLRATLLAPAPATDGLSRLIDETLTAAEQGDLNDGHARVVRVVERALLEEAMRRTDGNQSQVARWLGISRFTLRERLRALGLHPWADQTRD
jgi:DNA-binding NtrC family response regulator